MRADANKMPLMYASNQNAHTKMFSLPLQLLHDLMERREYSQWRHLLHTLLSFKYWAYMEYVYKRVYVSELEHQYVACCLFHEADFIGRCRHAMEISC